MTLEAFYNLKVNYSVYTYINNARVEHINHIYNKVLFEEKKYEIVEDGYCVNQTAENDAYLYRVIFYENISSLDYEGFCRTHPNVKEPSIEWVYKIKEYGDFYLLKISLINQGVVLSEEVKEYLNLHGGMRWGVYYAVDLVLENGCIVNSPLYTKLVALSPFSIWLVGDDLQLFYYSYNICSVKIKHADPIASKFTTSNIPVKEICLVATDRLRIQHNYFCIFKENNIPCKFCEVQNIQHMFSIDDIIEAIDIYFQEPKEFGHVLIGGLSNAVGYEKENILRIVSQIRKYTLMPIYLMILPPNNIKDIDEYVEAGITELGFNLECFDRAKAGFYMPGKGKISLKQYEDALKYAVKKLGRNGAVRSAFVIGLESDKSVLEGVRYLCSFGVAPIFSVFRPIHGTEMQDIVPYSNERLFRLVKKAEQICEEYGMKMGPECIACQNNTLSFDVP